MAENKFPLYSLSRPEMTQILDRPASIVTKFFRKEGLFLLVIGLLCAVIGVVSPYPHIAMWIGFGIAGYSAMANDSIQTLGTFLSSRRKCHWLLLWLFVGGIMGATFVSGWISNAGDIAFDRLEKIPQPESFTFLTMSAPVILLILTRFRMPVSTTFLLLSVFSSSIVIQKMLVKTFMGYIIAFGAAILVWTIVALIYKHGMDKEPRTYNHKVWNILQIASTTFLWWNWIMHDIANVSVFLPRTLEMNQMIVAVSYLVLVCGVLMYLKGGRIQEVVTEKTDVVDIRAATLIDFVYGIVLFFFKNINNIPMSTTWVFLGLLAGREIALTLLSDSQEPYKTTFKLVLKDIWRAGLGLLISLLLVLFIVT